MGNLHNSLNSFDLAYSMSKMSNYNNMVSVETKRQAPKFHFL